MSSSLGFINKNHGNSIPKNTPVKNAPVKNDVKITIKSNLTSRFTFKSRGSYFTWYSIFSIFTLWSITSFASTFSVASIFSFGSMFSVASIFSFGSTNSVLSILSNNCILHTAGWPSCVVTYHNPFIPCHNHTIGLAQRRRR